MVVQELIERLASMPPLAEVRADMTDVSVDVIVDSQFNFGPMSITQILYDDDRSVVALVLESSTA